MDYSLSPLKRPRLTRQSSSFVSESSSPVETASSGLTCALSNTTLAWTAAEVGDSTPGLRLVHRTNSYAAVLRASPADDESGVPFPAIWVRAMPRSEGCCCTGFLRRSVAVTADALEAEAPGLWSLFRVGSTVEPKGANGKRERIWNFALVPHGAGTRAGNRSGWRHEGEVRSARVLVDLASLLGSYFEEEDGYNSHVHIAVQVSSPSLPSCNRTLLPDACGHTNPCIKPR